MQILFTRAFRILAFVTCLVSLMWAAQWTPLGPEGGDVRSLAYDPHNPDRILLGTSAGALYVSHDRGASWSRLARLGEGSHYVLDNIIFDPIQPNRVYVAAWSVETDGGDLFRSTDGGSSWSVLDAMKGKSIRALALAASDPKLLIAGALDGVFRSRDGGDTWERISPAGHAEIKSIESLAIDPRNPDVIYAGTWHLPWKTDDGGRTWHSIKKGMIDDSDVFSIIIDRLNPSVVYASACSGIYKSETAGELFRKIQGIPFSARRTRVLQQDPVNAAVVYAGTTEGLWKTVDAGKTWKRITETNRIVNDVLVDPRHAARVLIATDRSGVLASNDGGISFASSNHGFAHRQVAAAVMDRDYADTIYAGVVNDKEFGGVFVTRDGGGRWEQMSAGLNGRDVFALAQSENGTLLAGTNRGIFALGRKERVWRPINTVLTEKPLPRPRTLKKKSKPLPPRRQWIKSELTSRVAHLHITRDKWFAATSSGLYTSLDEGRSWHGGPVGGERDFVAVHSSPRMTVAATPRSVFLSTDEGENWTAAKLPSYVTLLSGVAVADHIIWLASREGALRSDDHGATWEHVLAGLPARNVGSITYDPDRRRLLAVSSASGELFQSTDAGRTWERVDAGWRLRMLITCRGRALAATLFDGLVAPPEKEPVGIAAGASGGGKSSE